MRDEAEFVEFAQSARGRLRRTAYLLCGDWDRASDFVQEGLIRLYVASSEVAAPATVLYDVGRDVIGSGCPGDRFV